MIKINLEKKLFKVGISLNDFQDNYITLILDKEHKVVTKSNGTYNDRFSLNIDIDRNKNTKYKLAQIFLRHYNLNNDLKEYIDNIFTPINTIVDSRNLLTRIILNNPDEIENIINSINTYKDTIPENIFTNINNIIKKIFNYERDRNIITNEIKKADFRVCIYCNRNYISNFHSNNVTRATFTLDHFYQKDKYPIFGLSLYNLIPSCAVCNTNIKNTRNLDQYKNPYSNDYEFDEKAKFKLMPFYKTKLMTNDEECEKYIKDFYHNEIYDTHSKEIEEFTKKREVFTDDLIKKLSQITKHSPRRIKAFLFGEVIYKKILDTESLAKLKKDIAKELKII